MAEPSSLLMMESAIKLLSGSALCGLLAGGSPQLPEPTFKSLPLAVSRQVHNLTAFAFLASRRVSHSQMSSLRRGSPIGNSSPQRKSPHLNLPAYRTINAFIEITVIQWSHIYNSHNVTFLKGQGVDICI